MERRMELNLLLDFYGPLLTEARARVLSLYCEEDLSLGEIAEAMGITRQAVHDAINRASEQLTGYEQKLGMIGRYRRIHSETSGAIARLQAIEAHGEARAALDAAIEALNRINWIEE